MNEKMLVSLTGLIIISLFVYGFDFKNNAWEQIALIVAGYLFGNLTTIADYANSEK